MQTVVQNKDNMKAKYMGKRHVLPINNAGLYRKAEEPIPEVKEG